MKVKRLLMILVVVALVAYAALKGAVYFQLKSELDRLSALLAPFAALKYDGIESNLQGSVAVTGVSVTPAGAPVGIQIERVELRGEGTRFLLGLLAGFKPEQPPPRLAISIQRMRAPLGSGYLDYWRSAAPVPDLCSLGGLLGQTQIERLGYRQRVADGRLRYELNPQTGGLTLQLDYSLDDLAGLSMEATLANVAGTDSATLPVLERFSLHYRIDSDYMNQALRYCAGEVGQEPEAFIDGLFALSSAAMGKQLGFIPGPGLQAALRHLISRPGELLITALPDSGLTPADLQQATPGELVERLGIRVSVNDQPVTDLSFRTPQGNVPSGALFGEMAPTLSGDGEADAPVAAAPRPRARFMDTPVAQLRRYLGRNVRIYASDWPDAQQGILIALQNQQLELEQRMYGGKMTLYIPLAKVRRAEVWRREQVDAAGQP